MKLIKNFCGKILQFLGIVMYRYFRLTPPYLLVIGLIAVSSSWYHDHTILDLYGYDYCNCRKFWWRNILYVNTYFDSDERVRTISIKEVTYLRHRIKRLCGLIVHDMELVLSQRHHILHYWNDHHHNCEKVSDFNSFELEDVTVRFLNYILQEPFGCSFHDNLGPDFILDHYGDHHATHASRAKVCMNKKKPCIGS